MSLERNLREYVMLGRLGSVPVRRGYSEYEFPERRYGEINQPSTPPLIISCEACRPGSGRSFVLTGTPDQFEGTRPSTEADQPCSFSTGICRSRNVKCR